MKVEPFELLKGESHIWHMDKSETDKICGFSFGNRRYKTGKEFVIWCKHNSFAKR